MATAFAPPEGYDFEYDFSKSGSWCRETYFNAQEEYIERLRKFCKENTDSNSPLVGEIVRTHVADNFANYMVYRTKPLQLIHVPVGDAYHADPVWIRGLRLSDVKKQIEGEKAWKEICRKAREKQKQTA